MNRRLSRTLIAGGALALTQFAQAIDFVQSDLRPLQCGVGETCSFADAATHYRSVPSERVVGVGVEELAAARQELYRWLRASQAPVDRVGFRVELTRQDLLDIGEASAGGLMLRPDPRRYQVGVEKAVGFEVRFDGLAGAPLGTAAHMGGTVTKGLDGELVWTAQAQSRGATALRLGIEALDLPPGAALYAYSDRGEAFGPYEARGPNGDGVFWTNAIMGDTVNLQLHYAGSRDADALGRLGFRIASISHIGSRFPLADFVGAKPHEKEFCGYNALCVLPASASGGAPVSTAKEAVALILFSSQGGTFICSGGLLADTDQNTTIPYFLTANHCVSKGREANSVEAVFDFVDNCDDRYGEGNYPRTNGSSIKSTNRTSDYTLLELSQPPAGANRTYLGWDSAPVANSNGVALYRISHPAGAPQAYSAHVVDTAKPTCGGWPRGNWIYSTDTAGATEGGSSGSPVVNGGGLVVGQLTGGCGFNVGDVCDTDANATVDGAFAAYFSAVEPFLDPGNGGGGCNLGQKGDPCTVDADCCSNKCKGPTNNKTCR